MRQRITAHRVPRQVVVQNGRKGVGIVVRIMASDEQAGFTV